MTAILGRLAAYMVRLPFTMASRGRPGSLKSTSPTAIFFFRMSAFQSSRRLSSRRKLFLKSCVQALLKRVPRVSDVQRK